jgi:purine-nucleoside phosphorylase
MTSKERMETETGVGTGAEAEMLRQAVAVVRSRYAAEVRTGIVLGTGLGGLAGRIEVDEVIDYSDIPYMPVPTVETHRGRLVLGRLQGRRVAALQGRFHLYEGYTASQVAFPVRLLRALGAESLFVSFACGGMHPLWSAGDLVLLDDHINLQGTSPLVGLNNDELGPRFPDMSEPYDGELQQLALAAATGRGIRLRHGVYAAVVGPQLETRAEYRMLRALGADVVGMSTVPEVIAARHAGMRVLAVGIITDKCLPDALRPVELAEILRIAAAAEPLLTTLFEAVIADT